MHADSLPRLGGFRNDRLRREVERDTEDVGILDVEPVLFVQVVRVPTQAAPDHLLAQELRAEGAHAQNVGDGVGVPALRQHRDRNHAADGFTNLTAKLGLTSKRRDASRREWPASM